MWLELPTQQVGVYLYWAAGRRRCSLISQIVGLLDCLLSSRDVTFSARYILLCALHRLYLCNAPFSTRYILLCTILYAVTRRTEPAAAQFSRTSVVCVHIMGPMGECTIALPFSEIFKLGGEAGEWSVSCSGRFKLGEINIRLYGPTAAMMLVCETDRLSRI